jgi:hypothetical protein
LLYGGGEWRNFAHDRFPYHHEDDRAAADPTDQRTKPGMEMTERMKRFTAMVLAVAAVTPLAEASDPASPRLALDGAVFWIGQTEEAARKAIPGGYRSESIEGNWTLRANSANAQPYFIIVAVAKGHVTRVGFNWPVGSSIRKEAYSALLADALANGESCRMVPRTSRSEGGIIRRMEFWCGIRRLTTVVGDWPMGRTASITLE